MAIDTKIFNDNLRLTQIYCELQLQSDLNPCTSLRSINPKINGIKVFYFNPYGNLKWNIDPLGGSNYLYNQLFEEQSNYKREIVKSSISSTKFPGRILVAEVDMTVVDGASEVQSEGLIDGNDCPPIDTWFYFYYKAGFRIIYAWIPEQFVHLAEEAIAVNCVDCMTSYEDYSDTDGQQLFEKTQLFNEKTYAKRSNNFLLKIKSLFKKD